MNFIPRQLADTLTEIACKQYKVGFEFKQGRLEEIRKNEEFYYGRKIKMPKGRFGVPLPTMSGFVDTLMSKIDDAPIVKFDHGDDIADLKIARKVSAVWQKDQHPNRANWSLKDRWEKKLACFSGRAISKIYSESDPAYKNYYEVVDHEDFITEPMGGGELEAHLFKGQDNIFRSKAILKRNAGIGLYEPQQVAKLILSYNDETYAKAEDIYKAKAKRMERLGLNLSANTYVGQSMFRLIEWVMEYEGEQYYLLFCPITRIWVRAHKLKDVFESGLSPWTSWATHEDAFNFWSKAPCDDIRPIADSIDTLFNQALDNRYKRNFGMRAFDPDVFKNPEELIWKPDGLVQATGKLKAINQGIYEFKTEEITGTVDLIQFLDFYGGKKTGINPQDQGALDKNEQKVGIYFGNLQQMADRLGLYNKSYKESYAHKGLRYAWGVAEHLTEPEAVKIIGEDGVEFTELTRGEAKKAPDLDIVITGGSAEVMANEAKAKKRENVLMLISKDQVLRSQINPQWYLQETLKQGSFDENEIKVAVSKDPLSLEMMSDASNAIQMILQGKKPKKRMSADTSFIEYIINFANDKELKMNEFVALMEYAKAHLPIVKKNMVRRALSIRNELVINRAKSGIEDPNKLNIDETTRVSEPVPGISQPIQGNAATNLLKGTAQ